MKRKISTIMLAALLAAITALSCATNKKEYQVSEQTPAEYIAGGSSQIVTYEESACPALAAFEGGAFDYLKAITSTGDRRSGTLEYRCAELFVKNTLALLGYTVEEESYTFPFYQFQLSDFKVTRLQDGKEFPAFPMYFSASINGVHRGVLKRPVGDLTGAFVYLRGYPSPPGDVKEQYEKWKEKGALGVIREADMRPLAARGLIHPARAHSTSWYYSPLPGLVLENAHELIGSEIEVRGEAKIARGRGYNVVAKGREAPGGYILITAHLDSWFEGALDDGSGVAVMLSVARLMKDDPEGVIFLVADSEEIGLIGSAAYVQRYGVDQVAAVVELDMVSSRNNYTHRSPEGAGIMPRLISVSKGLAPYARKHFKGLGGRNLVVPVNLVKAINGGGLRTDMEWFYLAGVPGIFVYTPSYYYHTQKDAMEWIPEDDINQVAKAITDLVRDLRDQAGDLPEVSGVVEFDFKVSPAGGDTVSFKLRFKDDRVPALPGLVTAAVYCFFEQGFEQKAELKRGPDGSWRAEQRLARPGDWQFQAVVSKGQRSGKRWQTYRHQAD